MRIAYIGLQDLAGHKFNGMDLCREMRIRGHHARFYVLFKHSKEPWVEPICGSIGRFIIKVAHRLEYFTGLQNILSPILLYLLSIKHIKKSDIIHLQMIQSNYFSLFMIKYFCKSKKVFWTLHDPWPLTGHCVHPITSKCDKWLTGCGDCPNLEATFQIPFDSTKLMHSIKRKLLNNLDINLVVASDYMSDLVKKSMMFKNAKIYKIPFGIEKNIFYKRKQSMLRKIYNIPKSNVVLFFRAASSEFKGIEHIKTSLKLIDGLNKTLITVNETGLLEEFKEKFQIVELGWIEDDSILAEVYSASDIFLMPSMAESFGMMAIEAMACKAPIIAFNNTALSETLDYGNAGVLVDNGDAIKLAQEINRLSNNISYREEIASKGFNFVRSCYTVNGYFDKTEQSYFEQIESTNV